MEPARDSAPVSSAPPASSSRRARWPTRAVLATFPVALLVAAASLGGILIPGTYARETPNWTAQGVGQDWVDLLVAVPWLAVTALLAARRSPRALLLLAGGLLYTIYQFLIYAFAVHFNTLFLVYCATLGAAFFALVGVGVFLLREDLSGWLTTSGTTVKRAAGFLLLAVGGLFTVTWLGEIIPALVHGVLPRSLAEAGLVTNPVHVIDLSVILPLHLLAGLALVRRQPQGVVLGAIILGFGVLMAASIAGLMLVMFRRGFEISWPVFGGMVLVSVVSGVAVLLLLWAPPKLAS